MKVEAHQLIYPLLCLIFSGADVRTLADLRRNDRRLLAQPESAQRRYEALVQEAVSEILAGDGLEAAFNAVLDHFVVAALRQRSSPSQGCAQAKRVL